MGAVEELRSGVPSGEPEPGREGLKSRPRPEDDRRLVEAQRKVGELQLEIDTLRTLLEKKVIRALERERIGKDFRDAPDADLFLLLHRPGVTRFPLAGARRSRKRVPGSAPTSPESAAAYVPSSRAERPVRLIVVGCGE